jgi:uncharacterized protein YjgD (DUF1641 family)
MSEMQRGATIEEVLFEQMGVSVENAVATGIDTIDDQVSRAVDSGVDVSGRLKDLAGLLEQLTEPNTLSALQTLLQKLPQLAQLAKIADQLPNALASLGDVLDDQQSRLAEQGIDLEKSLTNGIHAILHLGSKIDREHLNRIGEVLDSEVFNPHAVHVVENAAKSLTTAQENLSQSADDRVGLFGLLAAIRDPQVQRSLAFAIQFGKCFGQNIEQDHR